MKRSKGASSVKLQYVIGCSLHMYCTCNLSYVYTACKLMWKKDFFLCSKHRDLNMASSAKIMSPESSSITSSRNTDMSNFAIFKSLFNCNRKPEIQPLPPIYPSTLCKKHRLILLRDLYGKQFVWGTQFNRPFSGRFVEPFQAMWWYPWEFFHLNFQIVACIWMNKF